MPLSEWVTRLQGTPSHSPSPRQIGASSLSQGQPLCGRRMLFGASGPATDLPSRLIR